MEIFLSSALQAWPSYTEEKAKKEKKILPRSFCGYFVGMESVIVLIKVFIPETRLIIQPRRRNFRKYEGTNLSGLEALHDRIARKVEAERYEQNCYAENYRNQENYNKFILNAFVDSYVPTLVASL